MSAAQVQAMLRNLVNGVQGQRAPAAAAAPRASPKKKAKSPKKARSPRSPAGGAGRVRGAAAAQRGRPLTADQKLAMKEGKDRMRAIRAALWADVGGDGRWALEQANLRIKAMAPGKEKRAAIRRDLYGGAPLYELKGSGIRGPLRNAMMKRKTVDPVAAAQYFATHGGIRSATACVKALIAAKKASRLNPNYRRDHAWNPNPLTDGQQRALAAAWAGQ